MNFAVADGIVHCTSSASEFSLSFIDNNNNIIIKVLIRFIVSKILHVLVSVLVQFYFWVGNLCKLRTRLGADLGSTYTCF